MIQSDLTKGNIPGHLRRMTIPMIWGILSIMSMNLVDTWYVGQLGTDPLAAMGFTIPIVSVLLSLAFGIGIGSSSLIARAIGSGQTRDVKIYATQSLLIGITIAGTFALIGYNHIDEIFSTLGAPDHLMPLIHEFMDIWFLGSFIVVVPMVGNSALRAAGNTVVPGVIMILVAVINIILDPILIFGYFGFPALGLAGAAIATIISYSAAFAVGLYLLGVKMKFLSVSACKGSIVQSWIQILRLAVPAMGTNLIAPLSVAFATWMVSDFGPESVAGFGVASRIESLCLVAVMAVSSIMGPVVGQNWGAGEKQRVAGALNSALRFCFIFCLSAALVLAFFGPTISNLFTSDVLVVEASANYLYWVPWSYFFLAVVMLVSSSYNGMGHPVPSLIMSFMRLVGLFVPLAIVMSMNMGLEGVYAASALSNLVVGVGALYGSRALRQYA